MSKYTQPTRSVRDIKILAGKAADALTPHKMYMRLFALETERHRRQQERISAMLRVTHIDARCQEIEQEKERLLTLLGVEAIPLEPPVADERPASPRRTGTPPGDPRRRPVRSQQTTVVEGAVSEAVKIRY